MCYRTLQHPDVQVNCLQITPDKHFIAAGSNPKIKLYEVNSKSADPLMTYEGHTGNVTSLGFQRDGRWMFSGSDDGTIKIWDLRAPTCQRDYALGAAVNSVALHPNQAGRASVEQQRSTPIRTASPHPCASRASSYLGTSLAASASGTSQRTSARRRWRLKGARRSRPLPSQRTRRSSSRGITTGGEVGARARTAGRPRRPIEWGTVHLPTPPFPAHSNVYAWHPLLSGPAPPSSAPSTNASPLLASAGLADRAATSPGDAEEYTPMRRLTVRPSACRLALAACAAMSLASSYRIPTCSLQAHRAYILSLRISPDVRYLATTSSDRTVG